MTWRGASVTASVSGRIGYVTLNRPQKINALDKLAFAELPQVCTGCQCHRCMRMQCPALEGYPLRCKLHLVVIHRVLAL
jgi:hypothetical protein